MTGTTYYLTMSLQGTVPHSPNKGNPRRCRAALIAGSLDTADIEVAELGEPFFFGGPLLRLVHCQPCPRPVQFTLEADDLQHGGGDALRRRHLHLVLPFCWRSLFGYKDGACE